jgi:DNA-binding MarR family transcriptional regulator
MTESSTLLKHANQYVELGFSIIPVIYANKVPLEKWDEFQQRKPTEQELHIWFEGAPKNIGIVCGNVSDRLVILDFDDNDSYRRFFPDTTKIESETPVVRTNRGVHVWLRTNAPIQSFNVPELHLNVIAEGKFALAPPSRHPNGTDYTFVNGIRQPLEVPDFLDAIRKRCEQLGIDVPFIANVHVTSRQDMPVQVRPWRRLPDEMQHYFAGVKEGERAERAFGLACLLRNEWRLPAETVTEWLTAWNEMNNPPLELAELQHAVDSTNRGYVFGTQALQPIQGVPPLLKNPELWKVIDSQLAVTVLEDPIGRQTTLLVALSAFRKRPSSLLLLGESAIGKTWLALQSTGLIPVEHVTIIGSTTARAWFYGGKSIYKEHPTLKDKKILSHYEIDWENTIVVILDNVDAQTIKDLKPIQSHDNPGGIIPIWVNMKTNSGKWKRYQVLIKGAPAFINCSTRLGWNDELATRHYFLTPRDHPDKYRAVAELIMNREVTGEEPVPPRIEEVRAAIKYLIKQNLKVTVELGVAEALKRRFSWKSGRDARDYERALNLVECSAWIHACQRERDHNGAVVADRRDLAIVEPLLEEVLKTSHYGTSGQVIEFYERVLRPLSDFTHGGLLTRDQIRGKYKEVYERYLNHYTTTRYIDILENLDLVEVTVDPNDKRKRLVRVLGKQDSNCNNPTPLSTQAMSTPQAITNLDGYSESEQSRRTGEISLFPENTLREEAILRVRELCPAQSLDDCVSRATQVLNNREQAKALINHLVQDGKLAEDPDGRWRWY